MNPLIVNNELFVLHLTLITTLVVVRETLVPEELSCGGNRNI